MVNLDPTEPWRGVVLPKLPSVHNANGCRCDNAPVETMRINHYLGSYEDYMTKTKRYWEVSFFFSVGHCLCPFFLYTDHFGYVRIDYMGHLVGTHL